MKFKRVLFLLLGVVTLFLLLWWIRLQHRIGFQDYENTSSAFLMFSRGNVPFVIEVRVIGMDGAPLSHAKVVVTNNSADAAGVTDSNGRARIEVEENDIEKIALDGALVFNRPRSYWLGYPYVEKGLHVLIVKKSLPQLRPDE